MVVVKGSKYCSSPLLPEQYTSWIYDPGVQDARDVRPASKRRIVHGAADVLEIVAVAAEAAVGTVSMAVERAAARTEHKAMKRLMT
ncbi:hypothetical protein ACWENQ_10140 [Nonomuraea sp. NPDC004354]